MIGGHWVSRVTWNPWDGRNWCLPNGRMGLILYIVYLTRMGRPGGAIKMSPLQMCMEGLKAVEEGGAKLDCLSMSKKLKVRHTRIDGPNGPKLEIRRQRRCRSGGKLGRCRRGGGCL